MPPDLRAGGGVGIRLRPKDSHSRRYLLQGKLQRVSSNVPADFGRSPAEAKQVVEKLGISD
jgi:hypothetical protein